MARLSELSPSGRRRRPAGGPTGFVYGSYQYWALELGLRLFILVGFQAYVVSLMHLEFYLLQRGLGHWILGVELAMNGLSAIGVYLGRFARLNSWDLPTHPIHLAQVFQSVLLSRHALVIIAILFVIFTALQGLLKRINRGLMLQKHAFQSF